MIGGLSREARRRDVQLTDDRLQAVIGLGYGGAVETIRLDDVASGLEIGVMNRRDDVGPRQDQQVVVSFEIAGMRLEALSSKVGFGQAMPLNHRAHRTVEHENPAGQQTI